MRPRAYLAISALNVLTGLVLSLILLVGLRLGLTGVYVASTATNVVTFIWALRAVRGTLGIRFSRQRLREILVYGTPLVPIAVATWAIAVSNRLFIRAHSGLSDVGLFSSGSKVAQIMLLAVSAFVLAWGPFAYSIAEEPDAKRTYARVLTFYLAVIGWLALALSIFAPLILKIARPAYAPAYQVVPPLTISFMLTGAYAIVAVGTSLSRKTIHISWTTIVAAVVALGLNAILPLLPGLTLVGGALATMCGNLVSVGLVYCVSQRLYPIGYNLRKVMVCVIILGFLILLAEVSHTVVGATSVAGVLFRLGLLALYPCLVVGAGVIERYEVVVLRNAVRSRVSSRLRRNLAPE
jgi:O-antigen/teichoic acid export membrane protein